MYLYRRESEKKSVDLFKYLSRIVLLHLYEKDQKHLNFIVRMYLFVGPEWDATYFLVNKM